MAAFLLDFARTSRQSSSTWFLPPFLFFRESAFPSIGVAGEESSGCPPPLGWGNGGLRRPRPAPTALLKHQVTMRRIGLSLARPFLVRSRRSAGLASAAVRLRRKRSFFGRGLL